MITRAALIVAVRSAWDIRGLHARPIHTRFS
jgi:hypothetical protein